MCCIFFNLLSHPDVLRKLQKEIDQYFPDGVDPIDFVLQAQMPYLDAVIKETMRLEPPAPMGSNRTPTPGGPGGWCGDHFMPEGTSIYLHLYSLHRNPAYFSPRTEEFWPERWLESEKQKGDPGFRLETYAFIPFSFGPTGCAGKNLAYLEMRFIVCQILKRFDISFMRGWDPKEWENKVADFVLLERGHLWVDIKARNA